MNEEIIRLVETQITLAQNFKIIKIGRASCRERV